MKVRKLAIALALAGGVTSNVAYAVGMGEARVTSHLNEPLRAEIELTRPGDFTEEDIRASLASRDNFERAGVQKAPILQELDMEVTRNEDGDLVIQVRSDSPMREPFLNFLVEIIWPNGRVMREYAFLIDPPDYREPAAAERPARPEAAPDTTPEAPEAPTEEPEVAEAEPDAPGEYGPVSANENLWNIAGSVRPSGDLTREQVMMALYEENPHAFMGNNINRLRRDVVIRIPPESDMREMSASEANQAVAQHHEAFAAGREVADTEPELVEEMAAADQQVETPDEPMLTDEDELRLVVDETGAEEGEDGSPGGIGEGDGSTELALALEELDRAQRERREMSERVEALEEQVATMEELIRLRDDQLAEMQARLGEGEQQPLVDPVAPEEDHEEAVVVPTDDLPEDEEPVAAEDDPEPATEEEPEIAAEDPLADEDEEAFFAAILNELRTNPSYQIGAGAIGVGLLALLLAIARRRKEDDAPLESEFGEDEGDILDLGEGLDSAPLPESQPEGEDETLAEASVYLAYGRLDQAEQHLEKAIEAEPERADLRLKMLEVQAEKGDESAFAEHRAEAERLGDDQTREQIRALASRMHVGAAAGESGEDDLSIDDLEDELKSMEQEGESDDSDDTFNFDWDDEDLGELDLGPDDDEAAADTEPSGSPQSSEKDDGLDFSDLDEPLTFEESAADDAEERAESAAHETDVKEEQPAEESAEEETIDFELDEDFDLGNTAGASSTTDESEADETEKSTEAESVPDVSEPVEETPADSTEDDAVPESDVAEQVSEEEPEPADTTPEKSGGVDEDFDDSFLAELDAELDKVTGDEGFDSGSDGDLDDLELDISDDDLALIDDVAGQREEKSDDQAPMVDEAESPEVPEEAKEDAEQEPSAAEEGTLEMAPEGMDEEALPELTPEEEQALREETSDSNDDASGATDSESEQKTEGEATDSEDEKESASQEPALDDFEDDEDFDFLEGTDETGTKLDLARAYVEMGDAEGAREILEEVAAEGSDEQKQEANKLLKEL